MPTAKKSRKHGLGNGLDALIPDMNPTSEKTGSGNNDGGEGRVMMDINQVEPNPDQPRKNFNEDDLDELVDSIKIHGIFTPLLVQKKKDYYEIIAGERRWRAAKKAGLKEVPVIVCNYSDQEIAEIQIIENVQRADLNPIEEAQGYKRLMEEFKLTQDQIAEKVSKKRTTITNAIRLLNLDDRVQEMVITDKLQTGHARAILAIKDPDKQYEFAQKVFDERMSVREVEREIKKMEKEEAGGGKPKDEDAVTEKLAAVYQDVEEKLKQSMGTKVKIHPKDRKTGRIEIEYYSEEELNHLIDRLQQV